MTGKSAKLIFKGTAKNPHSGKFNANAQNHSVPFALNVSRHEWMQVRSPAAPPWRDSRAVAEEGMRLTGMASFLAR